MARDTRLSSEALSRLRWRCRRGLLENDLIITRWLDQRQGDITEAEAQTLGALLDLADNDLLDLLLGRKPPPQALDTGLARRLLRELQSPFHAAAPHGAGSGARG